MPLFCNYCDNRRLLKAFRASLFFKLNFEFDNSQTIIKKDLIFIPTSFGIMYIDMIVCKVVE